MYGYFRFTLRNKGKKYSHNPRLNKEQRLEIYNLFLEGKQLKSIAEQFNVHPQTVTRIIKTTEKIQ